ncbi:MAG: helix-turn-helix domain-containing protein [Planctomycetes bacterium]|nr:helix-turn-helix domain-containing protein [Planctomycetota bacterium]
MSTPEMPPPLDPLLLAIGTRVRAARQARDLTLRTLAKASGVSERFLRELEAGRGNISVARLAAVAKALDATLAELVTDADDPRATASPERMRLAAALAALPDSAVTPTLDWLESRAKAPANADKIALIGLRGAGKTTIGKKAAARTKATFVELDREVERAAGMSLADLFAIHGEDYYRRLELRVLREVLAKRGKLVLAAGGGIVTEPESWQLLSTQCAVVWLEAKPEDHWNRVVAQGDRRPMQGKPQAMAELRTLLRTRAPLYARAHHRVDTSKLGLEAAIEAVIAVTAKPSC